MKIISLLSGGLDSTVLLYHLRAQGHDVQPISFDYGQRHRCELDAARAIAPDTTILAFPDIQAFKPPVPDGHYTEPSMKATVYPNRNMIMLALAAGLAIDREADAVAYAAHGGDHTIYPDCRPEFVNAMDEAVRLGNWTSPLVLSPFVYWTKTAIARRGYDLKAPLGLTWSCYKGRATHCGTCGTCVERREAFTLAGITDPTSYELHG